MELEDLFRLHRVSDPQVSPDGRSVAFVVTDAFVAENRTDSDVWIVSTAGGEPRKLTNSLRADLHPRWSPDGQWILFSSNRDGLYQVWVVSATGGEARKLTSISTQAMRPNWSPDGKSIAFVSEVYPEFSSRPLAESDALNAERDAAKARGPVHARVIDHLLYRHWDHWQTGKRWHLFVLPVRTGGHGPASITAGEPRDVTPGANDAIPTSDTFTESDEFAFAPDGRSLVFTAPPEPVNTQAWSTNHDLYRVDLQTLQKTRLTDNPAADCTPQFSPDGRLLAYRAQQRAGFEADRWQLVLLDLATGRIRSLTVGLDRSVGHFAWAADGGRIYFNAPDHGVEGLWSVVTDGTAPPVRLLEGGSSGGVSVSADGRTLAYVHQRMNQPPEVMLWHVGEGAPNALTHVNDTLLAGLDLPAPESVTVSGAGGTPVQMWILKPPGFVAGRKYPLVFWVHGGPQGAFSDSWSNRWNPELWAAQGYVLALPNPRGSTGFGQEFTDQISHDWSGRVMDDLFACLSYVEKQPYVDSARMAAAGASYGGYAMNWFEGHTDKFRTIICHDGVYDLPSMYGSTEEVWFSEWESGKAWEMAEADLAASPSRYAGNFRTPMLIIHNDLDFRVPMNQGMELFTALQRQGVPSRLVMFPDEGHWVLKPANSEFWHQTVFAWLADYLKP
jgi:dipeptidyl aminopeptidase/acylaminoacyl peptidase